MYISNRLSDQFNIALFILR